MRAPDDVKAAVVAYLLATVPPRCLDRDVKAPAKWFHHGYGHKKLGEDEWNAVFVEELDDQLELLERTDEHDDVFDMSWLLAIEIWVRLNERDGWRAAQALRGALKTVVVEALLDKPGLVDEGLVTEATGITTRYSPLFKTTEGVPACACELRVVVHSAEVLTRAPLTEPPIDIESTIEPLEEEEP